MSDEEIWSLDKNATRELSPQEREDQVVKEAEENYVKEEKDRKEKLERIRDEREHSDSRKDHWGPEKERTKVEGQDTNARHNFVRRNSAIPHFLQAKGKKIESKTAIRQAPVVPNKQIFDSRGRIEVRTNQQVQKLKGLLHVDVSPEKRRIYLDILKAFASKATNNKGRVNISDLEEIDRVLLGKKGTKPQTRRLMEAARKGEVAGVKIEKDTDMRNIFSRSAARKMKNAFEQEYNPEPAPAKPASTRLERTENPRFSSGNRGPGPSSSVRP